MQLKSLTRVSVVVVAVVLGGWLASPVRSAEDTPLHTAMESINKSYKKLRTQITDAGKNEDSLKLLLDMQKNVLAAKGEVPVTAEKVAAADKPKFIQGYRTEMNGLLTHLIKIETAVLEGKNSDAEKLVAGLMDIKKAGHDKFYPE